MEQYCRSMLYLQVQRLFSVLQMVSVIVKFHSSFIHPSCSFPACIKMVAIDGVDRALLDRSGVHAWSSDKDTVCAAAAAACSHVCTAWQRQRHATEGDASLAL